MIQVSLRHTPFAVERSTPDAHRWLVWALLVEIPLNARDVTRHHGANSWGRVEIPPGVRDATTSCAWSAARRTRQARQKHGYRDDDPRKQPSHETGRDAVCTATRSELNHPLRVLTVLRGELLAQDQQHPRQDEDLSEITTCLLGSTPSDSLNSPASATTS